MTAPTRNRAAESGYLRVGGLAFMVAAASLLLVEGQLVGFGPLAHLPGVNPWMLVAMFALAELLPVHFEHRREAISITLSTIPLVIGLVGMSPLALICARLAGSAVILVIHRRQRVLKLSVNLSSFLLQTAVSVVVFRALSGHAFGPADWPALVLAVLVGDTAQTFVLTAAISLYQGTWERTLLATAVLSSGAALVEASLGTVAVTLLLSEPLAMLPLAVVTALVLFSYRTHRSLGDRHRELGQLYDFANVMGEALLEGRVSDSLLEQARTLMHAEQAWLCLRDGGRLFGVTSDLPAAEMADECIARALEQTAAAGPSVVDGDDERIQAFASEAGIDELLVAPLIGRDGYIGALVVANRSGEVRRFGNEDLHLFTTIANHARASVENDCLVDRLRERAAESEHQSLHDALTGLPNRLLFSRLVNQSIERGPSAVMLLDLDRFKEVNDTLGHHNGDLLLQQVGDRLRTMLRRGDVVARLGGDEFGVLLPDIEAEPAALQVGRGIVEVLSSPFQIGDMSIDIGASIGVALAPRDGADAGRLIQRADVAMYTAKADQTGVESYRADRDAYSPERLMLVSDLKQAVLNRQLEVHYQPQVDLASSEIVGVEALVRWNHPTRGPILPDQFVAMAEQTGLMQPLTLFVLDEALSAARQWWDRGSRLRLSVNLSARCLLEGGLVEAVATALDHHGMPASALCLEVTESSIMADPRRSIATLASLRNLGVTISIDDFGTGQSSLTYIKQLPVAEIKIDKSFVLTMLTDRSSEAIVETVVSLGRNLGIAVTAEGIEDAATLGRLREQGCHLGQGYHFARPLPHEQLIVWLTQRDAVERSRTVLSLVEPNALSMAESG